MDKEQRHKVPGLGLSPMRKRQYNKRYTDKHPKKMTEYYLLHKEEILKQQREYRKNKKILSNKIVDLIDTE